MLRSIRFLSASFTARDPMGLGLLAIIIAIIAWKLSIVFSPTVRERAMERFHLGTDSFAFWSAQQAVPSMYNFENRIQFTNERLNDKPFDPKNETYATRTLNHFPARFVTFGDQQTIRFSKHRQGTFEMSSTFGDTELVTRWEIKQPDSKQQPSQTNSTKATASPSPMVVRRISKQWKRSEPTTHANGVEK